MGIISISVLNLSNFKKTDEFIVLTLKYPKDYDFKF